MTIHVGPRPPGGRRRVTLRYVDRWTRQGGISSATELHRHVHADPNPMPRIHVLVPRLLWRRRR